MKNLSWIKKDSYDGYLEHFVVSKKYRKLHIGKKLLNEFLDYARSKNAKSIYLNTDTSCSFKFYYHNGFRLREEKEITLNFSNNKQEYTIFLYDYQLDN